MRGLCVNLKNRCRGVTPNGSLGEVTLRPFVTRNFHPSSSAQGCAACLRLSDARRESAFCVGVSVGERRTAKALAALSMYHNSHSSGLGAESGRFPRSPTSFPAGRTAGGASVRENMCNPFCHDRRSTWFPYRGLCGVLGVDLES